MCLYWSVKLFQLLKEWNLLYSRLPHDGCRDTTAEVSNWLTLHSQNLFEFKNFVCKAFVYILQTPAFILDNYTMSNLKNYKVENVPPTVHYIPNFITKAEESLIMNKVYSAPKPKWTHLANRRVQDYGGFPHKSGLIAEKIPQWLEPFTNKINQLQVFDGREANHILVNEYLPGQGIMAHTDGPIFSPVITTISCGSHTILEFFDSSETRTKIGDVLLEPRSLVIIQNKMYDSYLHCINDCADDVITDLCVNLKLCEGKFTLGEIIPRSTRISLTIRNVPVVRKIKLWNL